MPSKCPVHKILAKLRTFAGLPVPFGVKWVDGKPDFRQLDEQKLVDAVVQHKCGVCGEHLGDWAWFVGGPRSFTSMLFNDPLMHYTCAKESIRLCPFLQGKRDHYRGELPNNGVMDTSGRPEKMYLGRARSTTVKFTMIPGGAAITGNVRIVEGF